MPAEVIDPKLNQVEKTWGILCEHKSTFFAIYRKKDIKDDLRFVGQGTVLQVDKYIDLKPHELWNGIEISREATQITIDNELTGPIYKMLNKRIKETFCDANGNPKKTLQEIKNEIRKNNKQFNDSNIPNADDFQSDFYK